MNKYPKYKPSNIPWLGDVPEHWEVLYLSQTCKEQLIKNTNNAETNVLSLSYGNIIRKSNIYSGLSPKDFATYQIVDKGNIILRLTDLQNDHVSLRTGLVRERGIITSAYTCLKPFGNEAYLQYLLHAYDTHKLFYGLGGGVRQSIGYKDIRYIQLPFPPLAEQTKIIHYLDEKLQKINKLTDTKKKQIDLLKEQKQAMINEAVTKGGEGWEKIPLRRFLTPISERNRPNLPLLSVVREQGIILRDINNYEDNHNFIPDDLNNYKVVRSGQFVMNKMKAWQGSYGVSKYTGIVSPAYYIFILNCECDDFFHCAIRSSYYIDKFAKYSIGIRTGQWDFPIDKIKEIFFLLPPLAEQQKIVTYLDNITAKIDVAIEKIEQEISLLGDYRTRLISDVVTGKINVQSIATDTAVNVVKQSEQQTKIIEVTPKQRKVHSKGYDDAVILTALVNYFGTDEHPFTAFDCQKFPYLLHRHIESVAENYGKFAAGPYNPALKYKTARPIALKKKYIREHTGNYKGFIIDENAPEAVNYFLEWYGNEPLEWINRFRYIPNRKDELELLTTVDMAMVELKESKEPITMQKVKDIIKTSPAWKAKLERPIFSDENIERAINWSYKLFGNNSL